MHISHNRNIPPVMYLDFTRAKRTSVSEALLQHTAPISCLLAANYCAVLYSKRHTKSVKKLVTGLYLRLASAGCATSCIVVVNSSPRRWEPSASAFMLISSFCLSFLSISFLPYGSAISSFLPIIFNVTTVLVRPLCEVSLAVCYMRTL